jgi:hypothetical protein
VLRLPRSQAVHRLVAPRDGYARTRISFDTRPRLGVADEPAQLLEHHRGGNAVSLELLDPLEPVDDGAGFVHVGDGSATRRTRS